MLLKRGNVFYCRVWVPLDMRARIGRRELKKSLRTHDRQAARTHERLLVARAEEFFLRARAGVMTDRELEILAADLISEYTGRVAEHREGRKDTLSWLLSEAATFRSVDVDIIENTLKSPKTPSEVAEVAAWYTRKIDELEREIATEFFSSTTRNWAKQLVATKGLNIDLPPCEWFWEPGFTLPPRYDAEFDEYIQPQEVPSTPEDEEDELRSWHDPAPPEFNKVCLTLLQAQIDAFRHELERIQGKRNTPFQAQIAARVEAAKPKKRLSDLWGAYKADRMAMRVWRASTLKKYEGFYSVFLDITGDCELVALEECGAVAGFLDRIQRYPKGKNQVTSQYRSRPFDPAWSENPGFKSLEPSQINDMLIQIAAWFDFALTSPNQWGISSNPFRNKRLPVTGDADRKPKSAYSKQDIQHMVTGLLKQRPLVQPERFWIPLLGLFTGARINELCQLREEDIQIADDIPIIHLRHKPELMQFTKAGKSRSFPVHPILLELGFCDFVTNQRRTGHDMLFPNLKLFEEKWSHKYGQWYNENFEPRFISRDSDKSFHSTRHAFISWFKQNLNMTLHNLSVVKSMVGHLDKIDRRLLSIDLDNDMTWGDKNYGDKHRPKVQLTLLKKLDYGVDFSVLKKKLA